jgi:hypothetical protein
MALTSQGCSSKDSRLDSPLAPGRAAVSVAPAKTSSLVDLAKQAGSPVGYEPAYVNGQTVTINAVDVPNHAPYTAQSDLYEVVYPIGWQQLGLAPPQCNPCDHQGNGIDFTDFHDHVLDSMPSSGQFTPLWHVWVIVPAYSGNAAHDALVNTAYASHLPAKSESAVDALLASQLGDGSPVAVKIDTNFYFLCAVVSPNAVH